MKSSLKTLVLFAAGLAAYLGYGLYREGQAARAAETLCGDMRPGLSVTDLTGRLEQQPAPTRVVKLADAWLAIYTGLPPFSRHICHIELRSGRVVIARLDHLD